MSATERPGVGHVVPPVQGVHEPLPDEAWKVPGRQGAIRPPLHAKPTGQFKIEESEMYFPLGTVKSSAIGEAAESLQNTPGTEQYNTLGWADIIETVVHEIPTDPVTQILPSIHARRSC